MEHQPAHAGKSTALVPSIAYRAADGSPWRILLPPDVTDTDPRLHQAIAEAHAAGTDVCLEMMRGASVVYRARV